MEDMVIVLAIILALAIALLVMLLPTIIAYKRGHHYTWVIFVLSTFGSALFFGFGWVIALIWAVWPQQTGALDPVLNDPVSNSRKANRAIYSRYGENAASFNAASSAVNYCPKCGAQAGVESAFCPRCGNKLNA